MERKKEARPCVLATSRRWHEPMAERLSARLGIPFVLITRPEDLSPERLREIRPVRVFLPHWSTRIPPEVWSAHECVIFHMTDLPFGRGGSPLQNLIVRGMSETVVCALRCCAELDAGPVYLRRPLSLEGSAREIFERAAAVVERMIEEIVTTDPTPVPQSGEPVVFRRRRPEEGDLAPLRSLREVYDHIRMLDADGYPHAFLETGGLRLEFVDGQLKDGRVEARVRISLKEVQNG